ncbi:MAG: molybdate ABC transporter substrate-binding protein [Pseudomonadota bacterium]
MLVRSANPFRLAQLWLALLCTMFAAAAPTRAAEPITVLAAASLTDAMQAVGEAYEEATGVEVRFSFASSSTLARQIEAGAPAQIVALADERWLDYLADRRLIEPASRSSPIGNRLVLIAALPWDNGPLSADHALDVAALLGSNGRLATGDPDHVPAGRYAKEALEHLGQWSSLEPRLARADNVRAALALVERGEAPLGIVYATDAAASDDVTVVATFPPESGTPITYAFALVAGTATPDAEALLAFMTAEAGLTMFERFGFVSD